MRINKGTYMIVALLLACTLGKAQLSVPFSMSPMAASGSGMVINGGSPMVFDGNGKCLSVSSGVGVLTAASTGGKGTFGASCAETAPVAAVSVSLNSVNLYPNPTHSTSILKCEGQFDLNLSCQVRVMSIDGRMMMSQMVPMKDMQTGFTINASNYANGTYVVTIDFMNQHYSKKLIKI